MTALFSLFVNLPLLKAKIKYRHFSHNAPYSFFSKVQNKSNNWGQLKHIFFIFTGVLIILTATLTPHKVFQRARKASHVILITCSL